MPRITSVEIANLRGIRTGKVDDIRPLTILTGTNGSGKSAVLDALLVGASPTLGMGIGRAVSRRQATIGGAHWLFHKAATTDPPSADITITTPRGTFRRSLELHPRYDNIAREPLPLAAIFATQEPSDRTVNDQHDCRVRFNGLNQYDAQESAYPPPLPHVRLIEPAHAVALHNAYSNAVRSGFGSELRGILAEVGVTHMEVLTDLDGHTPALYVTLAAGTPPLPISLAGDGIQSLAHTAIELATVPGGCALLEEPESFQHPLSFGQTAEVIVEAVTKRKIQVILTTHSQELIDRILVALTRERADQLSVITCALRDGELRTVAAAGENAFELRQELSEDLR